MVRVPPPDVVPLVPPDELDEQAEAASRPAAHRHTAADLMCDRGFIVVLLISTGRAAPGR
jgi:hypothetical protein